MNNTLSLKERIDAFELLGTAAKFLMQNEESTDETYHGLLRAQTKLIRDSKEFETLVRNKSKTHSGYIDKLLEIY